MIQQSRGDPRSKPVTIRDDVAFAEGERSWKSVLVSYHPIETVGNDEGFVVTGENGHARIDVAAPEGATCRVEHLPGAVATSSQDGFGDARDVWRARVAVPSAECSTVELSVALSPTVVEYRDQQLSS